MFLNKLFIEVKEIKFIWFVDSVFYSILYSLYIYTYIYQVNKNCEYPKNECPMHSYLIQSIHAEQNIYFCLKKSILLIKACQMEFPSISKFIVFYTKKKNIYIYIYIYIYIKGNVGNLLLFYHYIHWRYLDEHHDQIAPMGSF